MLCESGAGALAWWQIRNTPLANTAPGHELQEVYRRFRLAALIHEREIAYVLSLLRAEGIEPVLIKGWAIARLYPEAGLRPYGDIDLCIRPDQFAEACRALKCLADINGHFVDLHCGFARIGQTRAQDSRGLRRVKSNRDDLRVWDELFNRSQLVPLDHNQSKVQRPKSNVLSPNADFGPWTLDFGRTVRVPSDEDHLRLLSLHLLRSGARRPSWLCDVALLLETRAKDFNWNVCLGQGLDRNVNRNLNWIATTIGLAQQLLGADFGEIENAALATQVRNLPRWLMPAMLRQWGRSRGQIVQSPMSKVQRLSAVRRLSTLDIGLWTSLVGLWTRFDDPVRATAAVGGQFNNWPRLPYRVAELVTRLPEVPQQLQSLAEQFAARPGKLSRRVAAV